MTVMPPMDGLYNIQNEDDDTGYKYYRTVSRLPSLSKFGEECCGIADLLQKVISGYLEDAGFPEYNEILSSVFDDHSIGEFPSDRTMCFFIGDLDAFNPDFVRLLQEQVLTEFPLWRLLAQFEERQIGIYPQGAWFNNHWVDAGFDETSLEYLAWFKEAANYRDKRFGPLSRQLDYMRRILPEAMASMQQSSYRVLGTFDRYQPHHPGYAIWLLQTTRDEIFLEADAGPIRTSAVGDDGSIYPEYCKDFEPYTEINPPFWLTTYVIEPAGTYQLEMKTLQGKKVGMVYVNEIIPDETLSTSV